MPQAAQKAAPVDLQVKSLEGSDGGTEQLSLRVAEPTKSKGLVHRHVVLIQQNARQVSPSWLMCRRPSRLPQYFMVSCHTETTLYED